MISRALLVATASLALSGCGAHDAPAPIAEATRSDVGWPALVDLNPAQDIVEVKLVASPAQVEMLSGKITDVWAYRDGSDPNSTPSVPGPLLDVDQGQRVIVHFENELPEPTTIHWHGMRLPAGMDGTLAAQQPVEPGGTFTYEFVAGDAGFFWFHPHIDGEVQIERGLYAPLLVRGGVAPDVAKERVFVLDDVKINADGSLNTDTTQLDLMMGRQGNVLLVNGQRDRAIECSSESRERWRLVNSANGRFFNLQLPGHRFTVIGWDGGLLAAPYEVDTLLIAPGERYDVLVELRGEVGSDLELMNLHYDRGHDIPDPGPKPLMRLHFADETTDAAAPLPATFLPAGLPELDLAGVPERELLLTEEMDDADPGAEPAFFINGARWPDAPDLELRLGSTEVWSLKNDAEMDHPFHLHGMFFRLLDGGAPVDGLKDTVIVPKQSTVRVAVTFDAPGDWMFHCHILEHAERGMMGMVVVMP